MHCYFAVINKDVTSEEVQRVEGLVTYLEGEYLEAGLQKQVLVLLTIGHVTMSIIEERFTAVKCTVRVLQFPPKLPLPIVSNL